MFGLELIGEVALTTLPSVRMPGNIIGPIASVMGKFYNMLFDGLNGVVTVGALGLAIIIFTLVVKTLLFPLMVKQQKSSFKMQRLQPEMEKIKNKYKGKTDQLSQQKMAMEMQDFQKSNGISLMGGCLPLLIQLPILYALFYIFQNAYVYVDVIGQNYVDIANAILQIPVDLRMEVFQPYAQAFADAYKNTEMIKAAGGFDLANADHLVMMANYLKADDWTQVMSSLGTGGNGLLPLLQTKNNIETFLTIPMVSAAGLSWPGVMIPAMAAITTFAQTKITMAMTPNTGDSANPAASMMKTMNYVMPVMMGFFCISMPAGLGMYWTISNIFGIIQQVILQKYYKKKFAEEAVS